MMRFTGSSALHVVRLLATCALVLLPLAVAVSAQETAPAGEKSTYIVVLHDRPSKDGSAEPTEPDLPAMGGEVLHQWRNRRVVRMSEQAVRALAGHRGVKYIQRVQMDGALPELPRSETIAATTVVETDWAPPSWSSGGYVYDGDGNITAIGTAASPASDNGTEAYVYDSAGRLVSATLTHGSTHSEKYSYDAFGNLVETVRTAGPSTTTPVDAMTNRLAEMTYDAVGNLTKNESGTAEYYYDGFNMLRLKVTGGTIGAWYLYTADDERIGAEENGEIRWMIRDLNGRVLREWEASGWSETSWWLWREDYMHRGSGLAAAEREPAEGGTRHFHLDHLGTPRLITDANGMKFALHDYFRFGVERSDFRQEMQERGTDRPEPMKFTGHERDFTAGTATNNRNQLDYMHARYYSPVWGRFLSVDPTWDSADLTRPQSWNRYAYVSNNPINRIDPDGKADTSLELRWNRLKHIINRHIRKDRWQNKSKFVANNPKDVQKLTEKTVKPQNLVQTQSDGRLVYEKTFNKTIGTAGETTVRAVTEPVGPNSQKVITSTPTLNTINGFINVLGIINTGLTLYNYSRDFENQNGRRPTFGESMHFLRTGDTRSDEQALEDALLHPPDA